MKFPLPKTKRGWTIGGVTGVLLFAAYYLFCFPHLNRIYLSSFWNRPRECSTGTSGNEQICVTADIPVWVSEFVERELIIRVQNVSSEKISGTLVVFMQDESQDSLKVTIRQASQDTSEGTVYKGFVELALPAKSEAKTEFYIKAVSTKNDKGNYTSSEKKSVRLTVRFPMEGIAVPLEIKDNTVTSVGWKAFLHSFIKIILLPPWANGVLPLLALLWGWYIEQSLTLRSVYSDERDNLVGEEGLRIKFFAKVLIVSSCFVLFFLTFTYFFVQISVSLPARMGEIFLMLVLASYLFVQYIGLIGLVWIGSRLGLVFPKVCSAENDDISQKIIRESMDKLGPRSQGLVAGPELPRLNPITEGKIDALISAVQAIPENIQKEPLDESDAIGKQTEVLLGDLAVSLKDVNLALHQVFGQNILWSLQSRVKNLHELENALKLLEWQDLPATEFFTFLSSFVQSISSDDLQKSQDPKFFRVLLELVARYPETKMTDGRKLFNVLFELANPDVDDLLRTVLRGESAHASTFSDLMSRHMPASSRSANDLVMFFNVLPKPERESWESLLLLIDNTSELNNPMQWQAFYIAGQDLYGKPLVAQNLSQDVLAELLSSSVRFAKQSPEFGEWFVYNELIFLPDEMDAQFLENLRAICTELAQPGHEMALSKTSLKFQELVKKANKENIPRVPLPRVLQRRLSRIANNTHSDNNTEA